MRILITNDDGLFAPGIVPLVEWAKKHGEVTVVAPKIEQSGKSHAIEFVKPFEIKKVDMMSCCSISSRVIPPMACSTELARNSAEGMHWMLT